jgi:hypothetical protein
VLLRISNVSSINSAEGLKAAVAKSQFLDATMSVSSWSDMARRESHRAGVASSSASEAREVIRELLEMLGTAASWSKTGG